jgi:hypothetical protein
MEMGVGGGSLLEWQEAMGVRQGVTIIRRGVMVSTEEESPSLLMKSTSLDVSE